ncbi:MAG: adenine deaminase C-terminal domain-containing protein [[Clostridium] innocuum]
MLAFQPKDTKRLIAAALGNVENDLAIEGCRIFNVFTKEFLEATVYICDGFISHVEYNKKNLALPSKQRLQLNGILCPGFIDAHTHIESSLLVPEHYAAMVLPHGTTTVLEDAHEIANVMGVEGIQYMLAASQDLPMRMLLTLPSCVPSLPGFESSNAELFAKDYTALFQHPRVAGLGEVMDYEGVLQGEQRIHDLLLAAKKHAGYLQGHAPLMEGNRLSAYVNAGPQSDHEVKTKQEALDKYRKGMWIDIREANTQGRMKEILDVCKEFNDYSRICFCTDDRRCNVTGKYGHLDHVVRKAVSLGMPVEEALLSTSYRVAQESGCKHLGAIAPGYAADLVLLNNVEDLQVHAVFFEGKLVSKKEQLTSPIVLSSYTRELNSRNTIQMQVLKQEDFLIKAKGPYAQLNILSFASEYIATSHLKTRICPIQDGRVLLQKDKKQMYAAVFNRYGRAQRKVCIVENFGIDHGAVASSISHDSHNVCVVYDTPENGYLAVQEVMNMHGGFCAVSQGNILASLALSVAGLMSTECMETVSQNVDLMAEAFHKLGNSYLENPVSRITILNLLVCPYVKLSDHGLVMTEEKKIIPVVKKEGITMDQRYENVVLDKIPFPKEETGEPVLLSDETMQERRQKILHRMQEKKLDCIAVYADVEHGGNFEYLTGFIPRFEEALLILHKNEDAYLLLGNEVLSLSKHARIPAKGLHMSYFSLPDQPLQEEEDLKSVLAKAGVKNGMHLGVVGWKGFYRLQKELFDIPYYILEALKACEVKISNATDIFISPKDGARTVNNANEIAHYEYGQILAARGLQRAMLALEPGKTEAEIGGLLESEGQIHNVVTICSSGTRFEKANLYPMNNPIQTGERISLTVGYKGGLASRAAFAAYEREDLDSAVRDYEEKIAKPYFAAVCTWLEHLHIGMEGKEVYELVDDILPKDIFHWKLNPGHLTADEEWLSSPIYEGSRLKLKSGMLLQIDIIPSVEGYPGCCCENGVVLADAVLKEEIKKQYPDSWERMLKRRTYIQDVLGIQLHEDILPLSSMVAYYTPYLMNHDYAFTWKR